MTEKTNQGEKKADPIDMEFFELQPEIFSSFNNKDIAALIPSASDLLATPDTVDPDVLEARFKQTFGKQLATSQTVGSDLKMLENRDDPWALENILEKMEIATVGLRQLSLFGRLIELGYSSKTQERLESPIKYIESQCDAFSAVYINHLPLLLSYLSKLDDAKLREMTDANPNLQIYADSIKQLKKYPQANTEMLTRINSNDFTDSLELMDVSYEGSLSEEEKKQAFCEGLVGILKHKQNVSKATGYKDTLEEFISDNCAPTDLLDYLTKEIDNSLKTMSQQVADNLKLAEDKLPKSEEEVDYSWDEAKDIVFSAYQKFDPRLGAIAQQAFDENWILAKEYGIANPHAMSAPPTTDQHRNHPFCAINFDGSPHDVIVLAHEMAHVIAFALAGEKQRVFTFDAQPMVHEAFSHFAETLAQDEMLAREKDPHKGLRLRNIFNVMECNLASVVTDIKLEKDLYDLVAKENAPPSFEQLDKLYREAKVPIKTLSHNSEDIRTGEFWHIIHQPPHIMSVYPVNKLMAKALHKEYRKNPQQFSKKWIEAMEGGGNISIKQLWDKILSDKINHPELISKKLAELTREAKDINAELSELPDIAENLNQRLFNVAAGVQRPYRKEDPFDTFRHMAESGVPLDKPINGSPLLVHALKRDGLRVAKWLIAHADEYQIDLNEQDKHKKFIFQKAEEESTETHYHNDSALIVAAKKGSDFSQDYIDQGNIETIATGEIIQSLLEKGVKTDLQDGKGNTALHYAMAKRDISTIKSLLTHHASLDIINNEGQTPSDILNLSHEEINKLTLHGVYAENAPLTSKEWDDALPEIRKVLAEHGQELKENTPQVNVEVASSVMSKISPENHPPR